MLSKDFELTIDSIAFNSIIYGDLLTLHHLNRFSNIKIIIINKIINLLRIYSETSVKNDYKLDRRLTLKSTEDKIVYNFYIKNEEQDEGIHMAIYQNDNSDIIEQSKEFSTLFLSNLPNKNKIKVSGNKIADKLPGYLRSFFFGLIEKYSNNVTVADAIILEGKAREGYTRLHHLCSHSEGTNGFTIFSTFEFKNK